MSERTPQLDERRVRALFQELSERLEARGSRAQLFVVGGAAMALAYDDARLTRDVDAIFVPAKEVREIAAEMAEVHGMEADWLNDAAKGFMPGEDENPRQVFDSKHLRVTVPSPEYLLAMKLHASRDERDLNDAATLFNDLGYTNAQQGIDLLSAKYPASQLLPRHRYVVQDVVGRAETLAQQEGRRAGGETDLTHGNEAARGKSRAGIAFPDAPDAVSGRTDVGARQFSPGRTPDPQPDRGR